jgi:hypothetical protein
VNGPTRLAPGTEAEIRRIIREELRALLLETADASGREQDLTENDVKEAAFASIGETATAVLYRMTCAHEETYEYTGEPSRCTSCGKTVPAATTRM